jgi:hypothetical protein
MSEQTSTACVAIVRLPTRHYRKVAQEHWGLTDEQMKGMHVHHRTPVSRGGTDDPSNLYVCCPWFHSHIWHGEDSFHPMVEWCSINGSKGGVKRAKQGYSCSEETKRKMSQTRKGRKHSREHSKAISNAKKGVIPARPKDEETWKKKCGIAASYKHPVTTCPHCGKTGGRNALTRYHFENCKHKLN